MREDRVEGHLSSQVRKAGGLSTKIIPVQAGAPDRMIILPVGRIYLVETKAPDGRLRPIQRVWHSRAAARGVTVSVLSSIEEVDEWMSEHA